MRVKWTDEEARKRLDWLEREAFRPAGMRFADELDKLGCRHIVVSGKPGGPSWFAHGRDALFGGVLPGQDAMYSSAVGLIAACRRNIAAGSCLGRYEPAVRAFPEWALAFEKVRSFEEFDFVRAAMGR